MHVIINYIYVYLLFVLDIIILQLFIPRLFYGVDNRRKGSVLGTCIRLPTPPVYACKYNYIKNVK